MRAISESDFVSATSEVRRLGRFWISGSLESLERQARLEGDFGCRKFTALELVMASCVAVLAFAWAFHIL